MFHDDTHSNFMATKEQLNAIFLSLEEFNLKGQKDLEDGQRGFGGSCDVFRGWSTRHEKRVAVKRIRFFMLENSSFAKRLAREVRLWSHLDHENILPFFGFFLESSSGIPNLVSEWMGKGTITDYMRVHIFDAIEVCEMICGIASGLSYIHERNIVHADLKGNNILVSDDGRPLISDFGLSISDASTSLAATTNHGEKGTARWMAKELHWNPSAISFDPRHTAKTDIWAFGMVICELLTGKVPYASIDKHQVAAAISSGVLPQEPSFRDTENSETLHILWLIACECWSDVPSERPSAAIIHRRTTILSSELRQVLGVRKSDAGVHKEIAPYSIGESFRTLEEVNLTDLIHDIEDIPFALGSTCDILRARSSKHKKTVAVKRIRGFLVQDASYAKALGMRVRLWSKLDHPNVLPLLGFFLEGPMMIPNLVSEWMKNGTVREYMRNRPFVAREMCTLIYQLAKGLDYLHTEQHIIHSDLKGSNILVLDDGRPVVAGLLSSTYTSDMSLHLSDLESTAKGAIGTLRWMAKELLWNSSNIAAFNSQHTTQTDMWAFGMVICELLTRELPYENLIPYSNAAKNEPKILKVILDGFLREAPSFDQYEDSAIFRALWSIARKCWNEIPSRRPSARDVVNGLEFFVGDF